MAKRRVVVTGLGVVTALGLTAEKTWQGVLAGKSGVSLIDAGQTDSLDLSLLPENFARISASIHDFDPTLYMSPKDARKTDYFIQYGMAAAKEAIEDAKLVVDETNADRIGVAVGSGIGGLPLIEKSYRVLLEKGARRVSPTFIPGIVINLLPGHLSIQYGLKGPNIAIVTACTTGSHNIGMAARTIAYGDADVMIAGGSEMATCNLGVVGFGAMRALSTRNDEPTKASRPWDRDRDGFVLGDGAGILVLEEYEFAVKRGAKIYAELVGFGMSADAYHITMPSGVGAKQAMLNAINDAKLQAEQINYINAHATSTIAGDTMEIEAIKNVFGKHAYDLAVSSTKSMTGHLLGAAGAVEAVFSILGLRDQVAPPTTNLDNPDEGCDLNLVPHTPQKMKLDHVLSNSFGFGGTNASLIFSRVE